MKVLAALGLSIALLSGCGGSTTAQPTPTVTVTQELPAPTVTVTSSSAEVESQLPTVFGGGRRTEGVDMVAGEYRTEFEFAPQFDGDYCLWRIGRAETKGKGWDTSAKITSGYAYVTIPKGAEFFSLLCGSWIRVGKVGN
jgi:hypothetical protein